MRNKFTIITVVFLLNVSQVLAGSYIETIEKTFKMPQGGEVILSNTNGRVTIDSWDKNEVWLEAVKDVKAGSRESAEKIFEKIKIEIRHEDNLIEIETLLPRRHSGFWDSIFGNGVSISVSYRLKVPRQTDLDIESVNGKIKTSEVFGKLRFKTTNGAIRVHDAGGTVDAKTTNGSIEAELLEVDKNEDMTFRTTNGSIEVVLPKDLQANIDARTTNGRVRTDFPLAVQGLLSRRKIKGSINGGGAKIVLHTTNGGIRIKEW